MRIHAARLYVSPRTRPLTAEERETRRLAYALKADPPDPDTLDTAAAEMARLIDGPCWLVPVPTSAGGNGPNLALARMIAKHVRGARVAPHLVRTRPVPSSSARHRAKLGAIAVEDHALIRRGPMLELRPLYFVDNVATSGNTLEASHRAFGFGAGLVFADAAPPPLRIGP